jgi:DNA polymerase delta subunit 2
MMRRIRSCWRMRVGGSSWSERGSKLGSVLSLLVRSYSLCTSLRVHRLMCGMVGTIMGVLGAETPEGNFEVVELCYAGLPPQPAVKSKVDSTSMVVDGEKEGEWVALVSGLEMSLGTDPRVTLLSEWLLGEIEDVSPSPLLDVNVTDANWMVGGCTGSLSTDSRRKLSSTTASCRGRCQEISASQKPFLLEFAHLCVSRNDTDTTHRPTLPNRLNPSTPSSPTSSLPFLSTCYQVPVIQQARRCHNSHCIQLFSRWQQCLRGSLRGRIRSGVMLERLRGSIPILPPSWKVLTTRVGSLERLDSHWMISSSTSKVTIESRWRSRPSNGPTSLPPVLIPSVRPSNISSSPSLTRVVAGCYPFSSNDPFILQSTPHVYFVGNQPKFETKLVEGPEGQRCRIVLLPRFCETGEVVMVNTSSLEVKLHSFVV